MVWLNTCLGFLVAIAFIGVGATVVRAARPTSGYLFIAAGALDLLARCCLAGGTDFERMLSMDVDYDVAKLVFFGARVLGAAEGLLTGILVVVALVGLAKALRATPATPPSSG